jgi:hypothetical protein
MADSKNDSSNETPASENFDLYKQILDALKDRTEWELRQALFYRMRYMGIRRKFKPYPGCADQHFPLCDGLIERDKPFFYQQIYATDTLASFTPKKSTDDPLCSGSGVWFDNKLKQNSNFEDEILDGVDQMEQNGRTPIKIWWDNEKKQVAFQQIDPRNFIVPKYAKSIQASPWIVHVITMSDNDYKANTQFRQDEDFVKAITGKGTGTSGGSQGSPGIYKDQEVQRREGLTIGASDHEIVLWEVYEKEKFNGKWKVMVSTYSPLRPNKEDRVRPDFEALEDKGVFAAGDRYPFGSIQMEKTGGDWYSPRGNVEINAAFETSLCRTWNAKLDVMDFWTRPTYSSPSGRDFGNLANIKTLPGQVLPGDLTPTPMPQIPSVFDDEMQNTRALAEWRTKVPDLGAEQHLVPGSSGDVTATQINAIVGQSGQAEEMRSRVFRLCMADIYQMAWSILVKHDSKDLLEFLGDVVIDPSLDLSGAFIIAPNGSADSWNKQLMLQKAITLFQMTQNNGYADSGEAFKLVLEWMEPRWVKRVFRDPQQKLADQMEQQAEEIGVMMIGFPAQVDAADDDKAHLQSIAGFLARKEQTPQDPITPELGRLLLQHSEGHLQQLGQKKDKMLVQIRQQAAPFIKYLTQIASSDQGPGNVVPGPGAPPTSGAPAAGNTKQPSQLDYMKFGAKTALDKQRTAAAVANALANLMKAGAKITNADINAVLAQAGLPPLAIPGVNAPPTPNAA